MTRIPLSTDLKTRTLAPDKDARLKNCYIEGKGDPQSQDYQTMVRKRPAAQGGYPVNATIAQGGIGTENSLVVVNGDTLTTAINTNTTLTTQSSVLAFGATTITLPVSPTPNQSVTISNLGSGIVTVSPFGVNIPAGGIGWFIWDGFSWGYVYGVGCSTVVLPSTHDVGITQYAGPSETQYSVPAPTITYETIGYTPCGGQFRKIITKTYSSRSVANQWKLPGGSAPPSICATADFTPTNVASSYPTSYGATELACYESAASAIGGPTEFDYIPSWNGTRYRFHSDKFNQSGSIIGFFVTYANYDYDSIIGYSYGWYATTAASQLTLYYLDVHEVWTYDLI